MDQHKLDLTLPENLDVVEDLPEEGELGQFILALLDRARTEGRHLYVEGFGTGTVTVEYDGQKAAFYLKLSVDHGDEPIQHAHYALRTFYFKQPWVREAIKKTPDNGWLEVIPVTLSELSQSVAGMPFDLVELEKRYPNVLMGDILDSIAEESHDLSEFFTFRTVGGREFVRLYFKDEGLHEKYLNDDPQLLAEIKKKLDPVLARIHEKLGKKNRKTA